MTHTINLKKAGFKKLESLLIEADSSPELAGFVYLHNKDIKRYGIFLEDKLIGFFSPRQDPDLIWRMGAIYVSPKYRSRGYATQTISQFMKNKNGRSFIEDANIPSQKAYHKAKFKKVESVVDKKGSWYQNF